MPRPIQISVSTYEEYSEKSEVVALCDDGSIWAIQNQKNEKCSFWERLPDIPEGLTAKDYPHKEWNYQEHPEF